jgi:hypothetical protein
MAKTPKKKPAAGQKQVSEQAKLTAPGDPLPEPAPAGQRKVVTDKTGAKNRKKDR